MKADYTKWLRDNVSWLLKWLDKNKQVYGVTIEKCFQCIETRKIYSKSLNEKEALRLMRMARKEHQLKIIKTCVFSNKVKHENIYRSAMSGFHQQIGRFPRKEDDVVIEWFDRSGGNKFVSAKLGEYDKEHNFVTYKTICRLVARVEAENTFPTVTEFLQKIKKWWCK